MFSVILDVVTVRTFILMGSIRLGFIRISYMGQPSLYMFITELDHRFNTGLKIQL